MQLQDSILLPSQEALLQRMHHIVSYSEQLLVLSGVQGAGKSTLATALASSMDEYNSALVTCPMHADDAEIRRKILVQLLSNPLFDDEVPLADTLLRLTPSLTKPLHIILDDAHLLSNTLWAECIILSQLNCAGRSIAVTVTTEPGYLKMLLAQLPETHRKQILPLVIEPLDQIEREGLYYSLLSRSEGNPFTPREIVRVQLDKQAGSPKEVVDLLELALHGETAQAMPRWRRQLTALIIIAAIILALVSGWLLYPRERVNPVEKRIWFASTPQAQAWLDNFAASYLANYFSKRARALTYAPATDALASAEHPVKGDGTDASGEGENGSAAVAAAHTATDVQVGSEIKPASQQKTQPAPGASAQAGATGAADATANRISTQPKRQSRLLEIKIDYPRGYTLQLASVKRLTSLNAMLSLLGDTEGIKLARKGVLWVVLVGDYPSRQQAEMAASALKQATGQSGWIRAWGELAEYELQQKLPVREISD
jgi:DamX protein